MIVQEILEENTSLIKTYSDANKYIIQDETGDMYVEAVDPIVMNRTYTESDIDIEEEEEEEEEVSESIEEQ